MSRLFYLYSFLTMLSSNSNGIKRDIYWKPDEILSHVTQKEIFEYYLGITVQTDSKFRSPLRKDNNPTCNFKWYGDKLWYRDWAESKPKDCFNIVQEKFLVNFHTALEIIAEDFDLNDKKVERNSNYKFNQADKENRKSKKSKIEVKVQGYTEQDASYLRSYHIPLSIAKYYNVLGIRAVWVNGKKIYRYSENDPCLGYFFGNNSDGDQKWKIYFYQRKNEWRFISNTNRINGWKQIPQTGKLLVITKSLKDVMCLARFRVPAIAMQGEHQIPYQHIVDELKQRYDHIVSFLDFDRTGITNANKIKRKFGIPAYFLTDGRWNTVDYRHKDISDFLQAEGIPKTKKLLRERYAQITQAKSMAQIPDALRPGSGLCG